LLQATTNRTERAARIFFILFNERGKCNKATIHIMLEIVTVTKESSIDLDDIRTGSILIGFCLKNY
jgi:hypothetical protein